VKRAVRLVALVVVGLAVWTARVVVSGEAELRASDAALDRGEVEDAVVHARRAASLYAPGAPHVTDAYRRLVALALAAEAHHRRDTALFAWRSVRQAALDSRWLLTPHASDKGHAEEEIARLSALGVHENAEPDRLIEARQLSLLRHDERPRTGWIVVLLLGVAAMAIGATRATRSASGTAGRLDWTAAKRDGLLALAGLVAWLFAWWLA